VSGLLLPWARLTALILILLVARPGAAQVSAESSAPPQGWVTLMAEDFEGTFPHSPWHVGKTGDPYLWGQRSCNVHGGSAAMWGGGGGSLGSLIPCGAHYVTGFATTLSYGPLDLSGCSDLRVNFAHWTQLGPGDSLGIGFSVDGGKAWHVIPLTGNFVAGCGGWCRESLDQARWTVPLCGQKSVYLLFRFASNAEGVSYGTFVDDVSLEAFVATGSATPAATATAAPTGTSTPRPGPRVYLPVHLLQSN
jgi:hypothetical protein